MNGTLALLFWGLIVVALIFSVAAIRTTWVSSRLAAVTKAQFACADAHRSLAAAYNRQAIAILKRAGEERATQAVADAEAAAKAAEVLVEQAEARLPRGRNRRAYFTGKES